MTDFTPLADAIAEALEQALARREASQPRPLSEASMLTPREASHALGRLGRPVGAYWLEAQGLVYIIPAAEMNGRTTDHRVVIWGDVLAHVRGKCAVARHVARSEAPAESPAAVEAPISAEAVQRAANRLRRRKG